MNNNSELENNEEEVPAVVSSLSTNHCSSSDIHLSVNDDDIGLYVSKALSSNDFSLLIRLLTKPWAPGSTYVFPKLEQNGKTRSVCQHSWLAKYPWLSYSTKVFIADIVFCFQDKAIVVNGSANLLTNRYDH